MPALELIHEMMKRENDAGTITRQEAVSMIPPLLMDIQSHHKVRLCQPHLCWNAALLACVAAGQSCALYTCKFRQLEAMISSVQTC